MGAAGSVQLEQFSGLKEAYEEKSKEDGITDDSLFEYMKGLVEAAQADQSDSFEVIGSQGSSWQTREFRISQGWHDTPEPDEGIELLSMRCSCFEAEVVIPAFSSSGFPLQAGSQAGLYAYTSALSWVKLVIEAGDGDGNEIKIVLAHQDLENGNDIEPFVSSRITLDPKTDSCDGEWRVSLKLVATAEGDAYGQWCILSSMGHSAWKDVKRHLGWMTSAELFTEGKGRTRGNLERGDIRCYDRAVCTLPKGGNWRPFLLTEQWVDSTSKVKFQKVKIEVS